MNFVNRIAENWFPGFFHTLNTMPLFKKFGDPDFQGNLSFRGIHEKFKFDNSETDLAENWYPGVFLHAEHDAAI